MEELKEFDAEERLHKESVFYGYYPPKGSPDIYPTKVIEIFPIKKVMDGFILSFLIAEFGTACDQKEQERLFEKQENGIIPTLNLEHIQCLCFFGSSKMMAEYHPFIPVLIRRGVKNPYWEKLFLPCRGMFGPDCVALYTKMGK